MESLFKFELEENNELIDNTNINRLSVFVSDEQKAFIKKNEKEIFSKYDVDNFSDYVIKKLYEDVECKKTN
jgi:hypothetical protein